MLMLGRKQVLTVVKTVDFGIYLAEKEDREAKEKVLLPAKQVPAGTKEGDSLEVFIYKDSQDRMIATTREPRLQVGETGVLKVVQVTKIGAFLDWGLEKDLLLPYHEQTARVHEGQECLVCGQKQPALRHNEGLSLSFHKDALCDRRSGKRACV